MGRSDLRSSLIKGRRVAMWRSHEGCCRENSMCRGPVVELSMARSRNSKKVSVPKTD